MTNAENKKNILCIDDDKAMHTLLKSQITTSGYQSLHAVSGMEAFQVVKEKQVNLIILDINMPNMDGFQILRHLKKNAETEDIPVIFLSSLSRENLKVKGLEHGADDFIVKPFTGPELIARIKAVLRRNGSPKPPAGDVHGKLKDLGLFTLLHMLSFSGKSAVITFPEMHGELVAANGSVLSVRQGSWIGKEALLRLFFLEKGAFSIVYEERTGKEVGAIESLLLFISSALDEINDLIKSLAPESPKLNQAEDLDDFPEINEVKEFFPVSITELIFSMPGELKRNLSLVENALSKGKIRVDNN